MIPNLPIATDNIYKFACLFGLALILASILSYVSLYSATLDRKVTLSEKIIALEAKGSLTKAEADTLELNKKLVDVAKSNEHFGYVVVGTACSIGIVLSLFGAHHWHSRIQVRDDQLVSLQIAKLQAEVAKLEFETVKLGQAEANGEQEGRGNIPAQTGT